MTQFMSRFLSLLVLMCAIVGVAQPMPVTVRPADTGAALENPGMGWVFHHYDNSINGYGPPLGPAYDGREFPGLTVVYLRLAWSHLEPAEGTFNWSILDTPIQRYGAAGKRFALRFTVFEGDPKQGTPEWVRAKGAQGKIVETFGKKNWEPDYDDPIFLAALEKFLVAAGRRYGTSPNLAYVDVGTLGIWGEGHPIGRTYGLATLRRHIELHRKAFPHTLLVAVDDWARWFPAEGQAPTAAMDLARELGLTFRDDSLLVYPDPKLHYSAHLATPFWPERPVILEMDHYGATKTKKTWGDGSRYYQAVEDYHGSYISIHANPLEFLKENTALIAQINRRLGYRLNLLQATWPEKIKRTEGFTIEAEWRNAGVAPCLPGGHPAWSLFDGQGNLCAALVDDEWNVRVLAPGPPDNIATTTRQRSFALPSHLKPGEYELRVAIGDSTGTPRIALPLEGDDGHRRYRLGKLRLE
ncbi:MAG: DUF4832 domain-containing protein [Armatimonadota bacterium]|nr:DUF4832 domain-containing protein [Armatimonadota bacterium]